LALEHGEICLPEGFEGALIDYAGELAEELDIPLHFLPLSELVGN
jgi:hypothetical protein